MDRLSLILGLWLLLAGLKLQAQESVTVSGGDAAASSGSVAYSVGLVVYTNIGEASGSVTQGLQHAYEIYSVDIHEVENKITLSVFPNPTADLLTIRIRDIAFESLIYQLFDMNGRLLESSKITSDHTQSDMSRYPAAIYFLHVIHDNKNLQTFKIIKNKGS
jgi:hypothetical protein